MMNMTEPISNKVVKEQPTDRTPEVLIDLDRGIFRLVGRSIPEDTSNFYTRLLPYLYYYKENPAPQTDVYLCLEYFNTTTSKFLAELFRVLIALEEAKRSKITITWGYFPDDDLMLETGEEFQEYFPQLTFKFVEVKDEE